MIKCPNCGTENSAGEEYCINCGFALNQPSTGSFTTVTGGSGTDSTAIKMPVLSGSGDTTSYRTLTPNSNLQNGRYIIEKMLGQGGMGAAMLAKDTRVSNKQVVIKELISDSTDPQQRQEDVRNFGREVDTLSKIEHPLVPTVTDYFTEGTRSFMVQAYVAGENLEDHMERLKQPMPEAEALSYASQILDVLDYLEQQKPPIVHRDIKPANIIIGSKNKRAYLVDFGIARADEAKNARRKQTAALGTQGYAPPEQYQGNADPRSDLYGLGATLHHLLTNRDPREYPPFNYPPVRSLNPRLSPEIERVLDKALKIDINQRYQKAADMKMAIDDILMRRFQQSMTGSYTLGTSGPIAAGGAGTAAPANQSRRPQPQPAPATPIPPAAPPRQQSVPSYAQPGTYANANAALRSQQQQRRSSSWILSSFLLLLVVVLIAAGLFLLRSTSTTTGGNTGNGGSGSTPTTSVQLPANGIGAVTVNNELIGVSDGSVAFDTSRSDPQANQLKQQAAQSLQNKDTSSAQSLWRSELGIKDQSNDAETLIYLEDQRVLSSGHPYVTFVVGTMLTGPNIGVGRTNAQGAYVAQKEFNDSNITRSNAVLARLLIANTGSANQNAVTVAQQIALAASKDNTIVGVMGWPFSGMAQNALNAFSQAHASIPMVSEAASSDDLTGASPNFFRVVPPNKVQAALGAQYAQKTLGAKNVVVFEDLSDSYSRSLADAFNQSFKGNIVATENYTRGNDQTITDALQKAITASPTPDLIYFAGYTGDLGTLLSNLPANTPANLQILGGDALYELNYPQGAASNFHRLRFTAFAYPDEWGYQGLPNPPFFKEYAKDFDPNNAHDGNPYDYTRPQSDAMLAYDATFVMLRATQNALAGGKTSLSPSQLQQALAAISGSKGVQGVSGQITFGPDGNPVNKAVVILSVDANGRIMIASGGIQGKFLL